MWVIPYIITYKFSKITVSPRIMVLTNFDTPLWPRRTSRDQDLNKFESTLPLEASSQVPFFLTKWFLKDLDTMFNRERFLKNYSVIKLYSYKKKSYPSPIVAPPYPLRSCLFLDWPCPYIKGRWNFKALRHPIMKSFNSNFPPNTSLISFEKHYYFK